MRNIKKKFLNIGCFFQIIILLNACWQVEQQNLIFTGATPEFPGSRTMQIEGAIVDLTSSVLQYGHCYATHPLPTINDQFTDLGSVDEPKKFVSVLTGLLPETFYFIRAYMILENEVVYGSVLSVQTNPEFTIKDALTVITDGNSNITSYRATAKGRLISSESIPLNAYGHCWSTQSGVSLDNAEGLTDLKTPDFELNEFLRYESDLIDLKPFTRYYYRAYGITVDGQVIYGAEISFPTTQ